MPEQAFRPAQACSTKLLLFVHPAILGRGRPLFDGEGRVECDLVESAEQADGVTLQHTPPVDR
ncbi:MAG: hypothetical protein HZY73_17025 [Micropruina sp.]|nr:MAG: hypothetical protein HZY73_17025 [Micropruina sp.]